MATATRVTFSEFIDLLLVRLYDAERTAGDDLVDLNAASEGLRDTVPEDWILDAVKVIGAMDLANCIVTYGGCQARLTGHGRIFVEQGKGTGIIAKYRQAPSEFEQNANVKGTRNQGGGGGAGAQQSSVNQAARIERERQPAFRLLGELRTRIASDQTLAAEEREDLLNDVESLRRQLLKREPSGRSLAALLLPLSQVASIAGHVTTFVKWINASN